MNPFTNEILGKKSHPSVKEIIQKVGIVNIFGPSQDVLPVVRDAIRKRVKVVWMQKGTYNEKLLTKQESTALGLSGIGA